MKLIHTLLLLVLLASGAFAAETIQRIYSAPDPAAHGGISGTVNVTLTHALAVEHDRVHVYRGALTDGNKGFRFDGLPTGKYDLVLVTTDGSVYEGLALGEEKRELPNGSMEHLKARVTTQDAFFNRTLIPRVGFDGENALAFVERIRDQHILKQDATTLNATLRRLEIIELAQAGDDWQVTTNRHLYREEQPPNGINYLKHGFAKELGNLRVVETVKDLGSIKLSSL